MSISSSHYTLSICSIVSNCVSDTNDGTSEHTLAEMDKMLIQFRYQRDLQNLSERQFMHVLSCKSTVTSVRHFSLRASSFLWLFCRSCSLPGAPRSAWSHHCQIKIISDKLSFGLHSTKSSRDLIGFPTKHQSMLVWIWVWLGIATKNVNCSGRESLKPQNHYVVVNSLLSS